MHALTSQNKYGDTALIKACQGGHVETARVLLDHGANVDYQNKVKKYRTWTWCVKFKYLYKHAKSVLPTIFNVDYQNRVIVRNTTQW